MMTDFDAVTTAISIIGALIALGGAIASKKQADLSKIQADLSQVQATAAQTQAEAAQTQAALAERQLLELQKKVGMVADPTKMFEVLPAWYIGRMASDEWGFGLLLQSSDILAISRINGVSSDGKWMEVTMMENGEGPKTINGFDVLYAPTTRLKASVRIESVATAFEIWTS